MKLTEEQIQAIISEFREDVNSPHRFYSKHKNNANAILDHVTALTKENRRTSSDAEKLAKVRELCDIPEEIEDDPSCWKMVELKMIRFHEISEAVKEEQ